MPAAAAVPAEKGAAAPTAAEVAKLAGAAAATHQTGDGASSSSVPTEDEMMAHVYVDKNAAANQSLLAPIPPEQQLNLRWQRVCAFVSTDYDGEAAGSVVADTLKRLRGQPVPKPQKKQILHDVSGEMLPGELLAMMGPSGSGKTSLLSIIAGRAAKAVDTRGAVTSGGSRLTKAAKRRIGFVLQDDLLYESLTVWETLDYAAALRLPRTMTAAQRRERVSAVVAALGLGKCVDTIIGGFFRRGISGGERKRVSIGHELLINPALLLLDEPTSGLDSTTALHLLITLKALARGGRAVATTIHQPSSRLYQQLDRLVLLAEGHVVYYGPAQACVSWFSTLGFKLPYGVNVADFLLDLAQGEVAGGDAARLADGSSTADQQQQQQAVVVVHDHEQQQQAAGGLVQRRGGKQQGGDGTTTTAAVGLGLSGPAAVTALYSSYEAFAAANGSVGFSGAQGELDSLRLALEPPVAQHGKGGKGGAGEQGGGSFVSRSFRRAGSFLRLDSAAQQQQQQQQQPGGADPDPELGRPISRAWSRSFSMSGGGGSGGGGGGGGVDGASTSGCGSGCGPAALVRSLGVADRGGASFFTQWSVLLRRAIKVKRFESLSSQRFWQAALVAIITGLFWWQRAHGTTLLAASDVIGLLFFELLFPAFTAMFTALFVFPNDFRMLLKERASGMYRVSAFYAASAVSDLPMDCAYPVMFVTIIYLMSGLRLTAGAFFANLAAVVLNVLVAQSLGLFLGAAVMNAKTAQTVAAVIMLTFMLVGGYYVRGIPVWAAWVRYLSFTYFGFNLLLKIQFSGSQYVTCASTATGGLGSDAAAAAAAAPTAGGLAACHPVPDLQAALQLPTDPNGSAALEVAVLLAMLVGMRLLVYITLRVKTKSV